jgi:transposase
MLLAEDTKRAVAPNHQGAAAPPFWPRAETLPKFKCGSAEKTSRMAASDVATGGQSAPAERAAQAERPTNRGSLPPHLPRVEVIVDIDNRARACCQGGLQRIGEDRSERLDIAPAQFRVPVTWRPKDACRTCGDGVAQTPAPARLVRAACRPRPRSPKLVSRYGDSIYKEMIPSSL